MRFDTFFFANTFDAVLRSSDGLFPFQSFTKLNCPCPEYVSKCQFCNIASEASYVYILFGQKFIKNGQNGEFCQTEATCLTVLPDRPHLIEQKLIESAKIRNSNEAFFGDF